jgi:hypothetical protein
LGIDMSQRECPALNWPRFAVDAGEPVGKSPESVSWAWLWSPSAFPRCAPAHSESSARGVANAVSNATVLLLLSVFPASL